MTFPPRLRNLPEDSHTIPTNSYSEQSMFKELAPLLRHRSVLFTVSHLGDDQFRVNVVPKRIGDSENASLTTPVSLSGTADDLDAQLAGILVNFVSSHLELRNTLERAKADMAAAAK